MKIMIRWKIKKNIQKIRKKKETKINDIEEVDGYIEGLDDL